MHLGHSLPVSILLLGLGLSCGSRDTGESSGQQATSALEVAQTQDTPSLPDRKATMNLLQSQAIFGIVLDRHIPGYDKHLDLPPDESTFIECVAEFKMDIYLDTRRVGGDTVITGPAIAVAATSIDFSRIDADSLEHIEERGQTRLEFLTTERGAITVKYVGVDPIDDYPPTDEDEEDDPLRFSIEEGMLRQLPGQTDIIYRGYLRLLSADSERIELALRHLINLCGGKEIRFETK